MDLTAALDFKVPALTALNQNDASKLLHEIIGSVDRLFVLNFTILQLHQLVHHVVIDLLTVYVRHLCLVLDLLILYYAFFCITCRFKVSHCSSLDVSIDSLQLVLFLFRIRQH